MLKKLPLHLTIQHPFGNLFREATVLILCKTPQNTFILGEKKDFYPEGISRLLGGGVEKDRDDSIISAAQEELEEEILYRPSVDALTQFGEVVIRATASDGVVYAHTIYMFYTEIPDSVTLTASDDVTGLCELTLNQLQELAQRYARLSKKHIAKEGSLIYSWYDYGQIYGPVHAFAAEYAESLQKTRP